MLKKLYTNKAFKITLGLVFFLLILLYILPITFQQKIESKFEKVLENQLLTEASFSEIRLTFFKHFPPLTLSADDLLILGSAPFANDTLFYAEDFSAGISLTSLVGEYPNINEVFLNNANFNIKRDIQGRSNFDILTPTPEDLEEDSVNTDEFGIELNRIIFRETDFTYEDTSLDMVVSALQINYDGSGNFIESNVDLTSDVSIENFELRYAGIPFLQRDRVEAELFTEINTESTTLSFTRNNLILNKLPVDFKGKLEFIPGGYDMNFILESFNSGLDEIVSIFPEEYFPVISETTFGGEGDLVFSLQGLYLPDENQMPSIALNFQLRDGLIAHQNAEKPLSNLRTSSNIFIPSLDTDQIQITLDSIGFEIGEGFLTGRMAIDGVNPMNIDTEADMKMNIGALNKAVGTTSISYRGDLEASLKAKGIYSFNEFPTDPKVTGFQRYRIPAFNLTSSFRNGYIKWETLPEAMEEISFDVAMSTDENTIGSIKFALDNFNLKLLDKLSTGSLSFDGDNDNRVDAELISQFDLGDIDKFYPLDSGYQLEGVLDLNMVAAGNFYLKEKRVPVVNTTLTLNDGFILTPYYADPIEDISLELDLQSKSTSLKDLSLDLKPVAFAFIDHPFTFTADLKNFEDLRYKVASNGTLDLGKLYSVFGIESVDVDGYLVTDVSLEGTQSAAAAGRYRELNNQGSIEAENIRITTDYLPEAIIIEKGRLDFTQEKINLTEVKTNIAGNEVILDGYISNYLEYMVASEDLISGELNFKSSYLDLDKWMFFGEDSGTTVDTLGVVSGVILPPAKLDIKFSADVDSLNFNGLKVYNLSGAVATKPREIILSDAAFELAGGQVSMDAIYTATEPYRADFAYKINASKFDIKRAYDEVALFREMASFAEYAEGIASLDYELKGTLDANMYPILPSLEGAGVMGMDQVKLSGFKLMNSVAEAADSEDLTDPDLSDVFVETSIDNNLMTIPRTKMKIAGFRPRFEGQLSLDGEMRIDLRLGLPPLGILGIPMKITGNIEEYDMRIGKVTKKEELQEISDEEWEKEIKAETSTEKKTNGNN